MPTAKVDPTLGQAEMLPSPPPRDLAAAVARRGHPPADIKLFIQGSVRTRELRVTSIPSVWVAEKVPG